MNIGIGRTRKAFLNASSNILMLAVKTILSFIVRTVFIKVLGGELLGLNSLLTNIIYMLSMAELGIGSAINFSLYSPLHSNDINTISSLMSLYRRIYIKVGIVMTAIGIAIIPFLRYFVKDLGLLNTDVYIAYLLFLLNTSLSYFVTYKETLLNADQKRYKTIWVELFFTMVLYISQIVFLLWTKNYIAYLAADIVVVSVQRIVINRYITRRYRHIDFYAKNSISVAESGAIKRNVKALFLHKIGDYCVNGTDSLIISNFIDIMMVGVYSNYIAITTALTGVMSAFYNGATSSIGNLVASEDLHKQQDVFEKINFLAFVFYGLVSVVLTSSFNQFINLWVGEEFCLPIFTVVLIVLNFYITGMRQPCYAMKSATGLFDADKYSPILQALINLVVSIILAKPFGIAGVVIGTVISNMALPVWQRPYLIYKYIFKKSANEYFISYIKYFVTVAICSAVSFMILEHISLDNAVIELVIRLLVSTAVFCSSVALFYSRDKNLSYVIHLGKQQKHS